MAALKALCIGIDAYPPPATLGCCVNDARRWAETLEGVGFASEVLTDARLFEAPPGQLRK